MTMDVHLCENGPDCGLQACSLWNLDGTCAGISEFIGDDVNISVERALGIIRAELTLGKLGPHHLVPLDTSWVVHGGEHVARDGTPGHLYAALLVAPVDWDELLSGAPPFTEESYEERRRLATVGRAS